MIARIAAIVLALATAAGSVALCDGWKPSPAARMACCAAGVQCPMRHARDTGARHHAAPSQAASDACCAESERGPTSPAQVYAPPALALAAPAAPSLDLAPPSPVRVAVVAESPPHAPVPRYLLLSVLLV